MSDYEEMINDLANVWLKDAENGELTPPSVLRRCKYLIEQLVKERDELRKTSLFQAKEITHMFGNINKLKIVRDLAIADLKLIVGCNIPCDICCHKFADDSAEHCIDCGTLSCYDHFKWRGRQV